jgi:hypothetical protein
MKLAGIIYLHDITQSRMFDSFHEFYEMLEKLFGDEAMANVVLVTTMWALIPGEKGAGHEMQLKGEYWRSMLARGSDMARFMNTRESAWHIVGLLVSKERVLQIQQELVDQGKFLSRTSAGIATHRRSKNMLRRLKDMFSGFFGG